MRPVLLLVSVVLAGCVAPGAPVGTSDLLDDVLAKVGDVVAVDGERWSGEPSILALADGTLLITGAGGMTRYAENPLDAPGNAGQSYIWRSEDAGATWQFVALDLPEPIRQVLPYRNAILGVEGDLAEDESGRAYFVDLTMLATNGLAVSEDSGKTWTASQNPLIGVPLADRPWLAAFGDGQVYVKYLHLQLGQRVARSEDAGRTFVEDVGIPCGSAGPLVADVASRTVLTACADTEELVVFRTGEGAMSWERLVVAPLGGESGAAADFPVVAVARPGQYVAAWREASAKYANGTTIRLSATHDSGKSWSAPLDASPLAHTRVFPWVDADAAGRIAVVWYGTETLGDPNEVDAAWHPMLATYSIAEASNALSRTSVVRLVQGSVHDGSICTAGLACVVEGRAEDRRLLDFFEVDIDANGRAHVTWTNTTTEVPTVWYAGAAVR